MDKLKEIINESIAIKQAILSDTVLLEKIKQVSTLIADALKKGNKIILFGNGGSAADAQHIAAEFVGRFMKERSALPAIALNTNTSIITAIANDYGYENIFLRQLQALGQCGDVLFGFTTSGNSQNIIKAFNYASSVDIDCVSFTGNNGGEVKDLSTVNINVPSDKTPRIQEIHILLGHIICELVENML